MSVRLRNGWITKDKHGLSVWVGCDQHPYWGIHDTTWYPDGHDGVCLSPEHFDCEDPWPQHPNGGPDCILNISEMYKGKQ